MDLLIGAYALICDETLVSRNLKDFRRISNLRIESYSLLVRHRRKTARFFFLTVPIRHDNVRKWARLILKAAVGLAKAVKTMPLVARIYFFA